MRQATPAALDRLEPLLDELRGLPGLRERSRGNFSQGSKAFLHFHEDAAGLFADLKQAGDWVRHPVTRAGERAALLGRVMRVLAS